MLAVRVTRRGCPGCVDFERGCWGETGIASGDGDGAYRVWFPGQIDDRPCYMRKEHFEVIKRPGRELREYMGFVALRGRAG